MKIWSPIIRNHIEQWSRRLGNLRWWPQYVYHFTDIQNAVSIIQSGRLYSRTEATRLGIMHVDNASPDVLQHTRSDSMRYVRLYFRPRTPTQYRNEGIRPKGHRELGGAHCPIPVYFCFDAFTVLSMDDCEFSDGNMGSNRAIHSAQQDFFNTIPFHLVFHDGAIRQEEDSQEIIFRRHAEVLVPNSVSLEPALQYIACRSAAERQTLLHLLPPYLRNEWENRIRLTEHGFFFRKWTYVEEVVAVEERVIFRFNPNTITPGPFEVAFCYTEKEDNNPRIWSGTWEDMRTTLNMRVSNALIGTVTLTLDGVLAYKGPIIFNDLPF